MRSLGVSNTGRDHAEMMLHGHRFLLRAGLAIGNVFAWIFVFDYFFSLSGSIEKALVGVLLMYGLSQGVTMILTPIASAQLRHGTRGAMLWALILAASAFVVLGAALGGLFNGAVESLWGVAAFALFLGAYRALYFVPYELNRLPVALRSAPARALRTGGQARGNVKKSYPYDSVFFEMLLAFIPAFAGATFLVEAYAPLKLLFGAAAFAGISALPLFLIPNIHERFTFSYAETFSEFFARRNRRLLWTSFLEGAQGAALFLIWPLAVFLIIGGSYATLGVIFSVTLLCILLFRIVYRSSFSGLTKRYSTTTHITFAVSGWVARLAAGSPLGVVIADTYAYTAHPVRGTSVDPFVFEQSADAGSFIDEYTTLKELGLAAGRITLAAVVGMFVFATPVVVAFAIALLLAAVSAGISVSLARHHEAAQ